MRAVQAVRSVGPTALQRKPLHPSLPSLAGPTGHGKSAGKQPTTRRRPRFGSCCGDECGFDAWQCGRCCSRYCSRCCSQETQTRNALPHTYSTCTSPYVGGIGRVLSCCVEAPTCFASRRAGAGRGRHGRALPQSVDAERLLFASALCSRQDREDEELPRRQSVWHGATQFRL
jgi:hypothetical protein